MIRSLSDVAVARYWMLQNWFAQFAIPSKKKVRGTNLFSFYLNFTHLTFLHR